MLPSRSLPRPLWLAFFEERCDALAEIGGRADRSVLADGGFDLRIELPGPLPAAFYTQWIGEDVHHYLPAKFLGLWGVERYQSEWLK